MQHNDLQFRENTVALATRDAAVRPATFDATARTVEAVIATDSPVRRTDASGNEFLEVLSIAGADLTTLRGASVLDSHQQHNGVGAVLGTVEEAWREANTIVARIRLSTRPEIASVIEDVRNGIIASVSVGYEVTTWADSVGANGIPIRTATAWRPREVSFVAIPADPAARTRSADRASINRSIRELCTRAGAAELANDLTDRGATVEQANAAILEHMIARSRPVLHVRTADTSLDNPETFIRAAGEALYTRTNPAAQPSGAARQFVGLTIPDLARECLRRAGAGIVGMSAPTLVTRALHSTSDFPLILADTVGRTLRESYRAAPSGIRQLARQTTAADFRAKHRLMLDSTGVTLEKVNEHGEFKSGTLTEGEETYKVDTFGRIFGISRQALVNDDVGAFTDLSRRLGQAATAFEAQFLVDLLTAQAGLGPDMSDGNPLFHSTHGNVSTSGAAPSENTLSAARLAMRKQTGLGGGLIDVTPWAVLIPSDLETATEKLLTQIQAVTVDEVNPFAGLKLIVEPRLTSTTAWFVVASPATVDGLEFAHLAGSEGPQIESRAGFEVDGVQIRVRLDYGAGFVDHRGWYRNAGA